MKNGILWTGLSFSRNPPVLFSTHMTGRSLQDDKLRDSGASHQDCHSVGILPRCSKNIRQEDPYLKDPVPGQNDRLAVCSLLSFYPISL